MNTTPVRSRVFRLRLKAASIGIRLMTCDVTQGILTSALLASLRLFKIAPGDFVEPLDFMSV